MSFGNSILITANPGGKFTEGIISGTPKPGTNMQIKASTAAVQNTFTYEVFNQAADGTRALVLLLLEDSLQGKLMTEAYVTGTRCRMYTPLAGEQCNILFGDDGSGTSDDVAIGDRLMMDDTTGKFIADSSGESVPFVALEAVTDPTADQLIRAVATGV